MINSRQFDTAMPTEDPLNPDQDVCITGLAVKQRNHSVLIFTYATRSSPLTEQSGNFPSSLATFATTAFPSAGLDTTVSPIRPQ